jgi:predicted GIY-YIG superfamily endonuclease
MINTQKDIPVIGIYKITSPSNKVYIGSSVNITRRINNYKHKGGKQQTKLYNSLNKYGFENHIIEILEECSKNELIIKEKYWVMFYDSIKEGLNLQIPGENKIHQVKTLYFNKEWCKRISESKKGKSIKATKKSILQYDLEGNFIKEYESQREAERQTGINNSAINNTLKGISKNSGGFIWKYKN